MLFFIFILQSRESDGGAMHRTNPDSLRSCTCFRVFRLNFASDFFNLLLVKSHQAEIIAGKHLIKDATTRLGWKLNHQPCDRGRRKNDAPNHSATLLTRAYTKTVFYNSRQSCDGLVRNVAFCRISIRTVVLNPFTCWHPF